MDRGRIYIWEEKNCITPQCREEYMYKHTNFYGDDDLIHVYVMKSYRKSFEEMNVQFYLITKWLLFHLSWKIGTNQRMWITNTLCWIFSNWRLKHHYKTIFHVEQKKKTKLETKNKFQIENKVICCRQR